MSDRRSIRTRYHGILFRSKLEADWARAFDALGIAWEYEKEGRYFGDIFYLVDFWLPQSRQWVEVKGQVEPADCRKWMALLANARERPFTTVAEQPDIPLVVAMPGGSFYGWERGKRDISFADFLLNASRSLILFRCLQCAGWWFADENMGWQCQCCGAYDGDHFIGNAVRSPLPWPLHPRADGDPLSEAI